MNKALAHDDIVRRMKDYFGRQMAWFGQMHEGLSELEGELDEEQLDGLMEADSSRARISKELEEEFLVLKGEWDRTESIPEQAVEEVRAIALEAEKLAVDLQQALDRAAQETGKGAQKLRDRLGALRQGRQRLGNYRAFGADEAGFVDHQA